VDDVVMSCGHLADGVRRVLGDGSALGVRLRYVEEPRPLGTGGALKFAEELLDERFLMLNGDVLTDIDVSAQLAAHAASGARATLALYPVDDPSAYGLVRLAGDGAVLEFVEKPAPDQIDTVNISAGVYVLERSVLDLLTPGEPASIEREVFPAMVADGVLFAMADEGYWLDTGTPEQYLRAQLDLLDGVRGNARFGLSADAIIDEAATVERSVVSAGASVDAGAVLIDALVLPGGRVEVDAQVCQSIVGQDAVVGSGAVLDGFTVLGTGARAEPGEQLSGVRRPDPGTAAGARTA
jgi:mannose-1-phosphate guanylyltransferase